jgi:HlyD family secretion protein
MTGSQLRKIIGGLVIIAILAGAAFALWPKPLSVDIATIRTGPLEIFVEDEGVTRIKEVYTVSSPITGKVLRSPRKVGDEVVAEKTLVAVVEPSDPNLLDIRTQRVNEAAVEAASAAVTLAEAQVRNAESLLEFARSDLRRARALTAGLTISERAVDKAQLEVASGEAAVASANATLEVRRRELESAKANLIQRVEEGQPRRETCCIQLRAPVNGRVLKIHAESEQVVPAGKPLIEIGDPADLEVVVDLLSRDAVRVEAGATGWIDSWGGPSLLKARVVRVDPTAFTKVSALGIEEQRVETILEFSDPPEKWQRLGHEFRVIVRISVWRRDDVVQVPLGALFRQGAEWAVYVVEKDRAVLRTLRIGERNLEAAQVLSGLKPGDRVILHPSDQVGPDVAVRERPAGR